MRDESAATGGAFVRLDNRKAAASAETLVMDNEDGAGPADDYPDLSATTSPAQSSPNSTTSSGVPAASSCNTAADMPVPPAMAPCRDRAYPPGDTPSAQAIS